MKEANLLNLRLGISVPEACGTGAESDSSSSFYFKKKTPPDHLSCFLSLLVHELRPGDIKVVAAMGDSLTVSTELGWAWAPGRPCAECALPPHWLCIQHLADKIENLPVAGTETQPGSHETSLGNLERSAPCPSTVLLKHHLFHEAALHSPFPTLPKHFICVLWQIYPSTPVFIGELISNHPDSHSGVWGLPTHCPAPPHPISRGVL